MQQELLGKFPQADAQDKYLFHFVKSLRSINCSSVFSYNVFFVKLIITSGHYLPGNSAWEMKAAVSGVFSEAPSLLSPSEP